MNTKKEIISCPTCKKPNTWTTENKFKPFCSERCKLIDLGAWAAEEHKIEGQETFDLPDEDAEE